MNIANTEMYNVCYNIQYNKSVYRFVYRHSKKLNCKVSECCFG